MRKAITSKMVRSTRTLEENLDMILAVREAKSKGEPDRIICSNLGISLTTLQRYKKAIAEIELKGLTPEVVDAKRIELDDQVQTVVHKLVTVASTIDNQYNDQVEYNKSLLESKELDDKMKMKLNRLMSYPVGDMIDVQRAILNAIELRTKVWGLDKDPRDSNSVQHNRKIVLNLTNTLEADKEKLNAIADKIVGETNGVQMQKE